MPSWLQGSLEVWSEFSRRRRAKALGLGMLLAASDRTSNWLCLVGSRLSRNGGPAAASLGINYPENLWLSELHFLRPFQGRQQEWWKASSMSLPALACALNPCWIHPGWPSKVFSSLPPSWEMPPCGWKTQTPSEIRGALALLIITFHFLECLQPISVKPGQE